MKFIENFCLCLIVFMTIWAVGMLFTSGASVYSWIVVILLAVVHAYIIKLDMVNMMSEYFVDVNKYLNSKV